MNKTKWISAKRTQGHEKVINDSLLIRKNFNVKSGLKSAVIDVCGLGYGMYTVNSKRVTDDVLSTPFTAFDKRVIYNTYDITDKLSEGENVFGAFLGNGWYNDDANIWYFERATWRDNPKLAAKITLSYADGSIEVVSTDSSWKVCDGPCTFNHLRQGEIYDARLEKDGWDAPGYNDGEWEKTAIVKAPGGVLEPMDMPPIRVIRTINPISKNDKGIYDFGENISGWAKIKVKGEAGREVVIKYDERLDEEGNFTNKVNNFTYYQNHPLHHENRYILKGGSVEEYAPMFSYYGFRYVSVENAPEEFEITAEVVHTDFKTIGTFECSDKMLNLIHEASVRSTLTNYVGMPTDCPHREQNGWTGDAALSCEQTLMNFDAKKSYRKWLNDFKDVQRPSGQIPGIIPTSAWGYNWGSGPAWDTAMISIPWNVYQNTGDKSLIEQMWENNVKYFDFITLMSEDYVVDFGLGDWCPPPGCEMIPIEVTDTAHFYIFAKTLAMSAEVIGKDGSFYKSEAEKIRNVWRNRYLGNEKLEKSQSFLACAVYNGFLEENEKADYAKRLAHLVAENDYHIDCGIFGTKYIFTVLSEFGYADVLYKMVTNPTMPSYAYWINQGMTTFCENWDMIASCNHHMFSEVDNWFYKYVAGIRVNAGEIEIKPCFVTAVEKVKASHNGVYVEYDTEKMTVKTDKTIKVTIGDETQVVEKGIHEFKLARA